MSQTEGYLREIAKQGRESREAKRKEKRAGDFDFSNEASMAEQIARLLNDNALLLAIRDAAGQSSATSDFGALWDAINAYDNRDKP